MPRLSVWMIRGALLALVAGSVPGAWLLSGEPWQGIAEFGLRRAHIALMLFGWLAQFVLGVAYWMLPRYPREPERGSPVLAWLAYGGFQGGLVFAVIGSLAGSTPLVSTGVLLLAASGLGFLSLLWGRVRPFGAR